MYAAALTLSGAVTVGTTGIPFFHLGTVGPLPIQWFGAIVAAGVLIGAALLRRYAEWHKVSDEHIRGITGWITSSAGSPGVSPSPGSSGRRPPRRR